jgi:hypothetical protein
MPLHAEAMLLQNEGKIPATVGKNVSFYLFFYKNKK